MQAFVVMAGFLYLLRRRPVGLLWALGAFYLVLLWWRFHAANTEFIFQVLVRTTVRIDPFVVGVLAAAALPQLRRLEVTDRALAWIAALSLVGLVPLLYWCDHDLSYLHWGGTVLEWDLAVFLVAVALGARSEFVTSVVGNRPAVLLGRASLSLYIWHYPVFMFVQRHTDGWGWQARTATGLLATVAICAASERLVDRPVSAFLRRPGWRSMDDGVPAWLAARARPAVAQLRTRADHEDIGAR
jgi:peptidoglycan/LPS O-acetylase OafA/YrhL